ncbi:cyclin [Theileria orientalis]|uniref:Cyclin n=1 Tax=Theileria orientalis TaxID=68886 RepID=A0A976MEA0_THEOR|nr:cyclin [Theileria orientalis]
MENNHSLPGFDWPKCSTHYQNWLFSSVEKLKSVQTETYTIAAEKLKEKHPEVKIPSLDDELWIIKYYSHQLSRFLTTNNLKNSVKETSLTFFNRFYLKCSVIEYDPRIIMFTCITLATKLEDMWKSVYVDKLLASVQDLDISQVFDMECIVCDALNFNLLVLHTSDSIYTIVQMLVEYLKESLDLDDSLMGEHLKIIINIYKQAENNCINAHESPEFLFIYTPTQIALANIMYYIKPNLSSILSIDLFILKKLLNDDDRFLTPLLSKLNSIIDSYEDFLKFRNDFNSQENRDKARDILDTYLSIYELQ